jgi:Phosphate transport (Pho88)
MSGTKNLLIMGGAMLALKRIDQEDPDVLMYARMIFAGYVVVSLIINVALHFRVIAARDLTMITIPLAWMPTPIKNARPSSRTIWASCRLRASPG